MPFVGYWVIPFALLGLAALASRVLPERMAPDPEDVATEHADRGVGGGPMGDETRESWPSMYKVRAPRK